MRFLSVCSGIEAASVAWHPLGWEAVAFSEIEAFPSAVLEARWPGVPNLGDMTQIDGGKYRGAVDVLIGGTPCQDFSIAGKRAGLAGERSGLALHFARLVRDIHPRWLVWENVPGAFSTNFGGDFGAFAGALAELGYGLAWRVLDAQYWGVPQRRRRIFLVGYLGDVRPAGAVLFERESLRRHTAPRRETRKGVAGTLSSRTQGGGGLGTDFECAGGLQVTARCLSTSDQRLDYETETFVPVAVADDITPKVGNVAFSLKTPSPSGGGNPQAVCVPVTQYGDKAAALTARHDSSPCADRGMTIVGTLAASGAGMERPAGQGNDLDFLVPTVFGIGSESSNSMKSGNPHSGVYEASTSRTLDLNGGSPCCNQGGMAVVQQHAVRRLTPRECERLQGFPDDYTDIPWRGKGHAPDGPRYKALGNSMAVPVVRWLGERMDRAERQLKG